MLGQSKPGKTSRNQNNIYLMFYGLSLSCPSCLLNEDSSALPWHKKQSCKRGWSDILELQCQQAKQTPSTPSKVHLVSRYERLVSAVPQVAAIAVRFRALQKQVVILLVSHHQKPSESENVWGAPETQSLAEFPWLWACYYESETGMRSLSADWVSASITPQLPFASEG